MASCCPADVKRIVEVVGSQVTTTYIDLRPNPPVLIDQATFDALTLVKCPITETDFEPICIQPVGNTDASLVEEGMKCVTKKTSYADTQGNVDAVEIVDIKLLQADGTDVTTTYEQVKCPTPIVVETEACVAP